MGPDFLSAGTTSTIPLDLKDIVHIQYRDAAYPFSIVSKIEPLDTDECYMIGFNEQYRAFIVLDIFANPIHDPKVKEKCMNEMRFLVEQEALNPPHIQLGML